MKRVILIILIILLLGWSSLEADRSLRRKIFIECTEKISIELMSLRDGSYANAVDRCDEIAYMEGIK